MSSDQRIELSVPAEVRYLLFIQRCIHSFLVDVDPAGGSEREAQEVELAVHEAVANIVQHAYGKDPAGRIDISISLTPGHPRRLEVELRDSGIAFDPAGIPGPDIDGLQVGGYGLALMREIMDEVIYSAGLEGNRWRLIKKLTGTPRNQVPHS